MQRRATIAFVVQGLRFGGMERCAVQVASTARRHGYDARLILYDTPYTGSEAEYDVGDIPVTYVPRHSGVDVSLPFRLRRLFGKWQVDLVHGRNQIAGIYSAAALSMFHVGTLPLIITFDTYPTQESWKGKLASR